jgi:hypothetical protein
MMFYEVFNIHPWLRWSAEEWKAEVARLGVIFERDHSLPCWHPSGFPGVAYKQFTHDFMVWAGPLIKEWADSKHATTGETQ